MWIDKVALPKPLYSLHIHSSNMDYILSSNMDSMVDFVTETKYTMLSCSPPERPQCL